MRSLWRLAVPACMIALYVSSVTGVVMLKAGDAAPPFPLPGSDGKIHNLANYKGKQVVVLAWFTKAYSEACTAECKSLRESGDEIRVFDAAYFAVSVDPPDINRAFARSLGLDYPLLSDPFKKIAKAYGVVERIDGRVTLDVLHRCRRPDPLCRQTGEPSHAGQDDRGQALRTWDRPAPAQRLT